MRFAAIATKNLFRRKTRTFFTLLGIAAAVGAFIALTGLSRGFENAWMHALLERDTHVFAVPRGIVDILSASIDQHQAGKMAEVAGVVEVSGELVDLVDLDTGEMIIVAGWPLHSYLWESVSLERGTLPGTANPYGIVVGNEVAETMGLAVGDTIDIRTLTFTLTGISKSGGVMRNHAMLMPLAALQELNNRYNQVSTLNFKLEEYSNRHRAEEVLSLLREQFPDFVFTEALDISQNNRILKLFRAMAWSTSMIALFIGLVVILNTLLMSVMERTKELGLLAALGWSRSRVVSLIVVEGMALSLAGGVAGAGFGISGLHFISHSPQMQGLIQPDISVLLLAEVSLATFALGICGSIYPALRATGLNPAEALRHG
ncbi:MAG: FtsX-like permease family protein [Desulfopila sp.]|jgi:putative ABC transport system permease protein|nr:FtsX-like permease family protein [Desulfopila sp.]